MSHPDRPHLHLITDDRWPRAVLVAAMHAAAGHGADWIQLRHPAASARDLFDLARTAIAICRPHGVRVAVNDRIDVALAVRADGVQLSDRSLSAGVVRAIAHGMQIGVSVHDRDDAIQAEDEGADWVTFGHVFPTSSHPGEAPRGLSALAEAVGAVRIPVLAIGGIGVRNLEPVLAAGASGIAVISAILGASSPVQATAELRQTLNRWPVTYVSGRRPVHPAPYGSRHD